MKKKILVISSCPTHPQNSGNRIRIYRMLSVLRKMGHDIYFVYENRGKYNKAVYQKPNIKAMRKYWGDHFFVVPHKQKDDIIHKSVNAVDKSIGIIGNFLKKILPRLYIKLKILFPPEIFLPYGIDDWFNPFLEKIVHDLSQTIKFDIVIVEYVFLSKALIYFGKDVLKVIDTHDIFTNRHRSFFRKGFSYGWFSTTAREEAKGFNRADVIIAIQDKEKKFFSKLTNKPIITIGHLVSLRENTKIKNKLITKRIFFCGTAIAPNIHGVNWFIHKVWPYIKKAVKNPQLILLGGICKVIDNFDGCIKLEEISYENINSAYDMIDVVISPIFLGTGLKIKNIEALGYGKPLVTISESMKGLEKGAGKAFLVSDTPKQFAHHVIRILSDDKLRYKLSRNAYLFAKEYNEANLQKLKKLLSMTPKKKGFYT